MSDHETGGDGAWESLLRANSPEPPMDEVNWEAFHARIVTDAGPVLGRRSVTWWQLLGSGSLRVRALAAAAAIGILLLTSVAMPERPVAESSGGEFHTLEQELVASLPYSSVPLLVVDAENADVLDALLLYDGEEQ